MEREAVAEAAQHETQPLTLSGREQQVAQLLAAGYAVINVAAILELSEHTVRTYVRRLYRKLAVTNRVDLVRKLMLEASSLT